MSNTDAYTDPSAAKISPLDSRTKEGVEADQSERTSAGDDSTIDQSRIDPLGGAGQYQNPAPHADSHGVVGTDRDIQQAKIDPLGGQGGTAGGGLADEEVDAARIQPLGEVRAEMKKGDVPTIVVYAFGVFLQNSPHIYPLLVGVMPPLP